MSVNRCWSELSVLGGVAVALSLPHALLGQYAAEVLHYESGTGFATEFGSGLGYTLAASALGAPSHTTAGPFGGPVDPFSPPYLREQLVSIGQGGVLDVRLDQPARNQAGNPFGIDLLIFSNTGFAIVNGDFSGGGLTDGSRFGDDGGVTRVSVSADGVNYFTLDPALAPGVESGFPTDGKGDFTRPVDPSLKPSDFNGLGLAGIGLRYGGSGGGTGYDLAWARDGAGQPVVIDSAAFVRIEVLSGRAEIDGLAAVGTVPEPKLVLLTVAGLAAVLWRRGRGRGRAE